MGEKKGEVGGIKGGEEERKSRWLVYESSRKKTKDDEEEELVREVKVYIPIMSYVCPSASHPSVSLKIRVRRHEGMDKQSIEFQIPESKSEGDGFCYK